LSAHYAPGLAWRLASRSSSCCCSTHAPHLKPVPGLVLRRLASTLKRYRVQWLLPIVDRCHTSHASSSTRTATLEPTVHRQTCATCCELDHHTNEHSIKLALETTARVQLLFGGKPLRQRARAQSQTFLCTLSEPGPRCLQVIYSMHIRFELVQDSSVHAAGT
jgi:hypothetical protein